MSKLNLDRDKVDQCRELAETIVHPIQKYIDFHSTVSIERSVLRLFGLTDSFETAEGSVVPLANLVVDKLDRNRLSIGIAPWIAAAKFKYPDFKLKDIAVAVAKGSLNLNELPEPNPDAVARSLQPLVNNAMKDLERTRHLKEDKRARYDRVFPPFRSVVVSTGNIDEDIKCAVDSAKNGADVINFVRSSEEALRDSLSGGLKNHASIVNDTQENFRKIRKALDNVSEEFNRYIRLCHDSGGLCMPEIAVIGAAEDVDFLLNDSLKGIVFHDVNMKRSFVDQNFARMVLSKAGIVINTEENHYVNETDAYHHHHQVLASQFLNEQLGKNAGLREEQIGLGHAFEMDPKVEDSFIYELAMAQLVRDIFNRHPIKFMPPTQKSSDAVQSQVMDVLFSLCSSATDQQIHLLARPVADLNNPNAPYAGLKNANLVFNAAASLYDEIQYNPNGKLVRRARSILDTTHAFLEQIKTVGLMEALEKGSFAGTPRTRDTGHGLDGIFQRSRRYYNPFMKKLASAR